MFELGPYDHSKRLVIDPPITYATYLGGSYTSSGNSVAVYTDPVTGHVYAYVSGGTQLAYRVCDSMTFATTLLPSLLNRLRAIRSL